MLLPIPDLLDADEATACRAALDGAGWVDGRSTAGHLSAAVKHNQQLHWQDPVAQHWGRVVAERLERSPMFLSAALPYRILPPLFNRYRSGGHYGPHLDGAIRAVEGSRDRLRTDLSFTLFLSDPDRYDGGELVIQDRFGARSVKLPAGHLVLYPGTSIHHVAPVTRGERLAAFGWVQSLVRDDTDRTLLFELDVAIQQIDEGEAHHATRLRLSNIYNNLLRRWADI